MTNIISIVLVLITGAYVYLTWKIANSNSEMLASTNEQFQETIRPFVIARIGVRQSVLLTLEIENVGRSPARNLRLSIDKDFHQFSELDDAKNIRNFSTFNQVIETFAPGEVLRFNLTQGFNLNVKKNEKLLTPMNFTISASYGSFRKKYTDSFFIDITPYINTVHPMTSSEILGKIEEHLQKIERTLGSKI